MKLSDYSVNIFSSANIYHLRTSTYSTLPPRICQALFTFFFYIFFFEAFFIICGLLFLYHLLSFCKISSRSSKNDLCPTTSCSGIFSLRRCTFLLNMFYRSRADLSISSINFPISTHARLDSGIIFAAIWNTWNIPS